jgi:hypothetical protein
MRAVIASHFVGLGATQCGLATSAVQRIKERMFSSRDFLARALAAAGSQAEMARALDLPSSRVAEFFKEKGQRQRRLTMEEGIRLARAFDLPIDGRVSAEQLIPVLRIVLRHSSKDSWTDQAIERLAQEIELGLRLLQDFPQQDQAGILEVVGRAISGLHPDKRS